tara:strand:- start:26214 stop:27074 length:861 start_codon:yes stop_codon:yes gene_type:complete
MNINLKGITVKNLVKNKYVLYLVALIALVDILGYIMRQEFSAVLFFYLVGMITYFYTKNMTLVLLTSLIVTTLAHLLKNTMGFKEGMENEEEMENEEGIEEDDEEEETISLGKKKIIDRIKLQDKRAKDSKENFEDKEELTKEEKIKNAFEKKPQLSSKKEKENLKNVGKDAADILNKLEKKGIKSGYTNQQKLTPGLFNIPNKDQLEKQLGQADKIEAAYDNLEQVIGENGIKSMSDSTKELVRQQNELLKGLKNITPALHEAMGAIGKIDLGGLKSMFNATTSK